MIKEYSPSFEELYIEKVNGLRSESNLEDTQATMVEVRRQNIAGELSRFLSEYGFTPSEKMVELRTALKNFLKSAFLREINLAEIENTEKLGSFFPAYRLLAEQQATSGTGADGVLVQVADAELLLDINWWGDAYDNLCSAFTLADNLAQAGEEEMQPMSDDLLEFIKKLTFDQPRFQNLYFNMREVHGPQTTKEDVFYDVMETGSFNAEPDDTLDIVLDAGIQVLESDFLAG